MTARQGRAQRLTLTPFGRELLSAAAVCGTFLALALILALTA